MTEFPSPIDSEIASSLLLLSSAPFFFSSSSESSRSHGNKFYCNVSLSLSLASTDTRSCESALSNNVSSRKSADTDHMNFKIVKKRRTNVIWSSADMKPIHKNSKNPEFDGHSKCSNESKEESCLSTGSSEISSTESRTKSITHEKSQREAKNKESHRSSSVRRRAVKILEFLSTSCSSEVKIRRVLGDSADTSKALRMLLKMGSVKRSGAGGKHEPFLYKIA